MNKILSILFFLLAIKIGLVSPFLGPFGSGRGFQSLIPRKYWVFEGIKILAKHRIKDKPQRITLRLHDIPA